MALVTVVGFVRDHSLTPIQGRAARLFFRPNNANIGAGLMTGTEVQAELNDTTGRFEVELDNSPGVSYTPVMDWLISSGSDSPEMFVRGFEEWQFRVRPGVGGNIQDLVDRTPVDAVAWGFGPPTQDTPAYIDISGDFPVLYLLGKEVTA
ncbi:hypothetical protein AB0230_01765 [Microbacterium sp. NPDC089190]|uniref:hypothetical protein n=1 Tax=Microbacterium sp. NPDC089190 TaxID=3155063 RepID=UPI00344F7732